MYGLKPKEDAGILLSKRWSRHKARKNPNLCNQWLAGRPKATHVAWTGYECVRSKSRSRKVHRHLLSLAIIPTINYSHRPDRWGGQPGNRWCLKHRLNSRLQYQVALGFSRALDINDSQVALPTIETYRLVVHERNPRCRILLFISEIRIHPRHALWVSHLEHAKTREILSLAILLWMGLLYIILSRSCFEAYRDCYIYPRVVGPNELQRGFALSKVMQEWWHVNEKHAWSVHHCCYRDTCIVLIFLFVACFIFTLADSMLCV